MKKLALVGLFALAAGTAHAQQAVTSSSSALGLGVGISNSDAGASARSNNRMENYQPSFSYSTNNGNAKQQAPAVFAPGLAASAVETCLGSVSGGVGVPWGGLSFGTTTKDFGCERRLNARTLWSFGQQKQALAILCQDESIANAFASVGQSCPGAYVAQASGRSYASANAGAMATSAADPYFYNSKGEKFVQYNFTTAAQARRDHAIRAASGEWVVRAH